MRLAFLGSLLALAALAGCSEAGEVAKPRLVVERAGWDSLAVTVEFVDDGLLGEEAMQPDTVRVAVLGVRADTLAVAFRAVPDSSARPMLGAAQRFMAAVPDARLGSRERFVVEACGRFGSREVCEQVALEASPKRVVSTMAITFPEDERYSSGTYAIPVRVERLAAPPRAVGLSAARPDSLVARQDSASGTDDEAAQAWDAIGIGQPRRTLTAQVVQEPGARVAVPLAGRAGRFRLEDDRSGFGDFYFAVRSRLRAGDSVAVRFETTLRLGREASGAPAQVLIGSDIVMVSQKGEADREMESDFYARQAAQQLVRRMNSRASGDSDWYELRRWDYDRAARRYRIDMQFVWADPVFPEDRQRVAGTLDVGEDGSGGVFRLRDGNRRAFDRWRVHFGEDRVVLEPLPRWQRGLR